MSTNSPPTGPDDQTTTLPADLLFDRNRSMSELGAKFLRGFFLTLAHVPAIDHHVVLVGHVVDSNRTERKLLESHTSSKIRTVPIRGKLTLSNLWAKAFRRYAGFGASTHSGKEHPPELCAVLAFNEKQFPNLQELVHAKKSERIALRQLCTM